MPPSIPFLLLPPVAQLLILEYLSLFQLVDFSFLSKRTSQIAKSRKRNVEEFRWYADYQNGRFHLRIIDYDNIHFTMHIPRDNQMNTTGEITLEERKLRIRIESQDRMLIGEEGLSKEELTELFDKLTEHFLAMLNVENYALLIRTTDLENCFMWKYTKTLELLWIHADELLTAREMEFVLGELTVTGELRIDSKIAEGFQWTEPLNTEHIHLRYGRFLSVDVYLNSEVKEWHVYDRTFPSTHLNSIMKKWLDGGLPQLKSFEQNISSNNIERLNEALEGIQTVPWNGRRRPGMWHAIDAMDGRDLRRSDGRLATAGAYHNQLYFVVWEPDQVQAESNSSDEDVEEDED